MGSPISGGHKRNDYSLIDHCNGGVVHAPNNRSTLPQEGKASGGSTPSHGRSKSHGTPSRSSIITNQELARCVQNMVNMLRKFIKTRHIHTRRSTVIDTGINHSVVNSYNKTNSKEHQQSMYATATLLIRTIENATQAKQAGLREFCTSTIILASNNGNTTLNMANTNTSPTIEPLHLIEPTQEQINDALDMLEQSKERVSKFTEESTFSVNVNANNQNPTLHLSVVDDDQFSINTVAGTQQDLETIYNILRPLDGGKYDDNRGCITYPITMSLIIRDALKDCANIVLNKIVVQCSPDGKHLLSIHPRYIFVSINPKLYNV